MSTSDHDSATTGAGGTQLGGARGERGEPVDVSLYALLANPQPFDGRLVRVIGFLALDFEGTGIYAHEADFRRAIHRNGVWVCATAAMHRARDTLHRRYALVEGRFHAGSAGPRGMWSGGIDDVRRAEAWTADRFTER